MKRFFFDTNILIYSVDKADTDKQNTALKLIEEHLLNRTGVLSTQVLQEFFVASTRKLDIDPMDAKQLIQDFQSFDVVQVTPSLINTAIDRSVISKLSFWDSLIVECALIAKCSTLFSEDMNNQQSIDGCQIQNPFDNYETTN